MAIVERDDGLHGFINSCQRAVNTNDPPDRHNNCMSFRASFDRLGSSTSPAVRAPKDSGWKQKGEKE